MDPILVLAAIDTRRGKGKEVTLDSTYVLSISQYNKVSVKIPYNM